MKIELTLDELVKFINEYEGEFLIQIDFGEESDTDVKTKESCS